MRSKKIDYKCVSSVKFEHVHILKEWKMDLYTGTNVALDNAALMRPSFVTYLIYIALSVMLTIWVARTLSKNGRLFLVRVFADEALADSVNHLLVVGFYLLNFGYASLTLKMGIRPTDAVESMELLSTKIGCVLVVLGGMHFFNLYVFSRIAQRNGSNIFAPRTSNRA
jgi:hypothetical protein